VPNATTVRPTTSGEIPHATASREAPRTSASAPAISATSPSTNISACISIAYSPARPSCSRLVGDFPGELRLVAAEVAVARGAGVDRAQQVEHLDDALGAQVEVRRISSTIRSSGILPVPKVSTISEVGLATPIA
jgi:hypothetical protein